MMAGVSDEPGVTAVTDELYAGAPAAFVGRRDELAKLARASGDRELAAQIKALRRPSVGAWYLNVASRAGLLSLRELMSLGEELRQAQALGDFAALRVLAGRTVPLVTRVLHDLTAHLAQVGVAVSASGLDEVRSTLAAALADSEVAAQLSAGRLDRPHTYGGFGEIDPATLPWSGTPAESARPGGDVGESRQVRPAGGRSADQQAALRAQAREVARREVLDAERALADLGGRRAVAEAAFETARARLARLAAELDAAQGAADAAGLVLAELATQEQALTARIDKARGTLRS